VHVVPTRLAERQQGAEVGGAGDVLGHAGDAAQVDDQLVAPGGDVRRATVGGSHHAVGVPQRVGHRR